MEFGGPGLATLSMDERATLANMATECSARVGHLRGRRGDASRGSPRAVPALTPTALRARAACARPGRGLRRRRPPIDLGTIEPMVAHAGRPRPRHPVRPHERRDRRRPRRRRRSTSPTAARAPRASATTSTSTPRCWREARRRRPAGRRRRALLPPVRLARRSRATREARGYLELFRARRRRGDPPRLRRLHRLRARRVSDRPDQVTVSAINRNFKGRSGPGRLYLASPLDRGRLRGRRPHRRVPKGMFDASRRGPAMSRTAPGGTVAATEAPDSPGLSPGRRGRARGPVREPGGRGGRGVARRWCAGRWGRARDAHVLTHGELLGASVAPTPTTCRRCAPNLGEASAPAGGPRTASSCSTSYRRVPGATWRSSPTSARASSPEGHCARRRAAARRARVGSPGRARPPSRTRGGGVARNAALSAPADGRRPARTCSPTCARSSRAQRRGRERCCSLATARRERPRAVAPRARAREVVAILGDLARASSRSACSARDLKRSGRATAHSSKALASAAATLSPGRARRSANSSRSSVEGTAVADALPRGPSRTCSPTSPAMPPLRGPTTFAAGEVVPGETATPGGCSRASTTHGRDIRVPHDELCDGLAPRIRVGVLVSSNVPRLSARCSRRVPCTRRWKRTQRLEAVGALVAGVAARLQQPARRHPRLRLCSCARLPEGSDAG